MKQMINNIKMRLTTSSSILLLFFACALILCNSCTTEKENHKLIIELVGTKMDKTELKTLAKSYGISDNQLYYWKNHVVVYTALDEVEAFRKEFNKLFPNCHIKIYDKPFYNFSKSERCPDSSLAKEWKHYILTANLTKDKALQQEYMEYHRTQFEEWPEVAQGFCNADFQQLLLYRNGRQLMLVISIPANKTLDQLNSKTTENNPRMDEWNAIMGKYQEGIEGTFPGEKWVFLNNIDN